jgi:hypothetical protein
LLPRSQEPLKKLFSRRMLRDKFSPIPLPDPVSPNISLLISSSSPQGEGSYPYTRFKEIIVKKIIFTISFLVFTSYDERRRIPPETFDSGDCFAKKAISDQFRRQNRRFKELEGLVFRRNIARGIKNNVRREQKEKNRFPERSALSVMRRQLQDKVLISEV